MLTDAPPPESPTPDATTAPVGALGGSLRSAALVALATGLSALVRSRLALADVVMIYLLVIMVAAARYGRGPSVVASALSVVLYDFFFVPPYHTLAVHDASNLLTFAMMFAVGQGLAALLHRVRASEREARLRGERSAALLEEARAATLRAHTEAMRSTLLSAVSHDLRTPLAAITGAATALRDDEGLAPDQRRDMVETVCEEAERMERLVGNLLDMTRLESGALKVKREWVPLEEVVGSALTRLEARLAGRAVTTEIPATLPLVSVDPVLLEQVFVNLLENAAKYTPAGTPVEVRASVRDDGGVRVTLADRGPGIPAENEARVFEKFYRGAHVGVRGVGLGLPISRGMIEAHGGTLTVHPRDGGGAEFTIELPPAGPEPTVPPEEPDMPTRTLP